jgi:hypothetical protein
VTLVVLVGAFLGVEDMPALRPGMPPIWALATRRPGMPPDGRKTLADKLPVVRGAVSMVSDLRHQLGMEFPRSKDLGHPTKPPVAPDECGWKRDECGW